MSERAATAGSARVHARPAPTRVRHHVRDALTLMAFSAATSVGLAVALTALAVVLG